MSETGRVSKAEKARVRAEYDRLLIQLGGARRTGETALEASLRKQLGRLDNQMRSWA